MKSNLLLISLLVAYPAFATSFSGKEPSKGTATTDAGKKATTPVNAPVTTKPMDTKLPPLALGPQVTGMFRILKADGSTVIAQTAITVGGTSSVNVINVASTDALQSGNGRCAFNAQYDEVSGVAATSSTNRIFSNDALVAQNTKVDLVANVLKSTLTQPYLVAGQNNVRVMINADSASPSVGWVRVNVSGSCGTTSTSKDSFKDGQKDGAPKDGSKETHSDSPKTAMPPSGGASAPVTMPSKDSFKDGQKDGAPKDGSKETHSDSPKTAMPPSGGASAPVTMPSKDSFKDGQKGGTAKDGSREPRSDSPKTATPPSGGASAPVTMPSKDSFKDGQKDGQKGAASKDGAKEPAKGSAHGDNKVAPDSVQWKNLATAFSYSTYGVTLLKGNKDFTRYADLAKLNADIGVFISAKAIDEASFNALMIRWNSFATDESFRKALMAVMPSVSDKK